MNWPFCTLPDASELFHWHILIPNAIAYIIMPLISFRFFSQCLESAFWWRAAILYLILHSGLSFLAFIFFLEGTFKILAEICLLALFGIWLTKKSRLFADHSKTFIQAFTLSALTVSLKSICGGILQWADFFVFSLTLNPASTATTNFFLYLADSLRECLKVLLFFLLARLILIHFGQSIKAGIKNAFPLLMIPLLFISLVEQAVTDRIYGNTIVTNRQMEIVFPVIDHGEMLFLQLFACACLFFILAAYQDIIASFYARQTLGQLKQQARELETYIRESRIRDEKTRAFRHDMKNHLLVLAQLLKAGQAAKAYEYLTCFEESLSQLSCPIETQNAAVDALLGSKFSIAKEKGISVCCELAIPKESGIPDYDWCIILANAADNAIAACGCLPEGGRQIHILGSRKGNFYRLLMENSCLSLLETVPKDGIGLSNIRAVAEKYGGTVCNSTSSGIYRLEVLLILPNTGKPSQGLTCT